MTHASSLTCNLQLAMPRGLDTDAQSARTSQRAFAAVSALLFAASAALTIVWRQSMLTMGGMTMPGGWTMSMTWMRMPGLTWAGSAASFLAMWVVMMAAMMLPSFAPTLWRYREAIGGASECRKAWLIALTGVGYFVVWTLFGAALYPLGVAIATLEMDRPALARAVPIAAGLVVLIAGALQFTNWKAHHLACCRESTRVAGAIAAWCQGMNYGLHCSLGCANLTAVLLVLGVMDLRVMAGVTVAISAERLAPVGERVARATGFVVVGAAVVLIARAAGL